MKRRRKVKRSQKETKKNAFFSFKTLNIYTRKIESKNGFESAAKKETTFTRNTFTPPPTTTTKRPTTLSPRQKEQHYFFRRRRDFFFLVSSCLWWSLFLRNINAFHYYRREKTFLCVSLHLTKQQTRSSCRRETTT